MYEQVKLVRPVHLDFSDDIMKPGTKGTIVDLIDDGVVLIEFDFDAPELVGGKTYKTAVATVHDFVSVM